MLCRRLLFMLHNDGVTAGYVAELSFDCDAALSQAGGIVTIHDTCVRCRQCAAHHISFSTDQHDIMRLSRRLLEAFSRFTTPASPPTMRRAAHAARSSLLYAFQGADATISAALDAAAAEQAPVVRCLLYEHQLCIGEAESHSTKAIVSRLHLSLVLPSVLRWLPLPLSRLP